MYRSFVAIGVDPAMMDIGPTMAIFNVIKAIGLEIDDIDFLRSQRYI